MKEKTNHYKQMLEILDCYSPEDLETFKSQGLGKVFFEFMSDTVSDLEEKIIAGFEACSLAREIETVKIYQDQAYTLSNLLALDLDSLKEYYKGRIEDE